MNTLWIASITVFGQTTPPAGPGGPGPGAPSAASGLFPIALMMAMLVFLFLTMRSQRKRERREKEELHNRMAKGHRVVTVGGAIGTIMAVKNDEVVVKVDETTNTKMTFIKSAIQRIIDD